MRLEILGKLNKRNDLIRIRVRDLPAYSIKHQPSTLPHDPTFWNVTEDKTDQIYIRRREIYFICNIKYAYVSM
jgi:hypothetical protein